MHRDLCDLGSQILIRILQKERTLNSVPFMHRDLCDLGSQILIRILPKEAPSNDGIKTEVLITIWILGNLECLRSVAYRFNITKSILFRVYRRMCGAIPNNLSGQYMKYLLVRYWAPLGKMINFGSVVQRNALDQRSIHPSLAHADWWYDWSLSRVD